MSIMDEMAEIQKKADELGKLIDEPLTASALGRMGGSSKSDKKREASRANLEKGRAKVREALEQLNKKDVQ